MDLADLESLAVELLTELRVDLDDPPSALTIARKWLGAGAVDRVRGLVGALSDTYTRGGRTIIAVKASLPDAALNWAVAHETGHLLLARARAGLDEAQEEHAANYIAGALLMPARLVVSVYREHGLDAHELAERVCVTDTAAALRLPEVLRLPAVVVSPAEVRRRGCDNYVFPHDEEVRRIARRAKLGPGLTRIRIADARGRVGIIADPDFERDVG